MASLRSLAIPMTVFGCAAAVRIAYWAMTGPIIAGDTPQYLRLAQAVAAGNWSALRDLPFHSLYPIMLAPVYLFGLELGRYVAVVHILLSAGSVVLLWAITRRMLRDPAAALVAAAIGTVYPNLLFWLPYILTETPFIFLLLTFTLTIASVLEAPSRSKLVLSIILTVFLFFLRPVAIGVIAVAFLLVILRLSPIERRKRLLLITAAVMVLAVIVPLMTPSIRDRLIRIPTIGQTLWLSTTVIHGTQAEVAAADTPAVARDWPLEEQYAYKGRQALQFILAHPIQYVAMAIRRLVSYWTPWWYLDWSWRHRVIDAVATGALILAACCWLAMRDRGSDLTSIAFVVILSLESTFGQIDADARYRLPSEVLLIPSASAALATIWSRLGSALAMPAR